ncbi:hypothetical protein EMPS_10848 [Entomortierella parvispora]|uniref:Uncharacterized protein n=1 Tax=Entomortierella parvispora TaxID=205924 RepID=A0A9P3M1K5_9FUNG|nr:hypothetical protein EMPS_10848 [Entomortierella parvispora]
MTKLSVEASLYILDEEKEHDNSPVSPEEYAALLEPDSEIVALPVIEVVFGDSLYELFFASSDAYKSQRQNMAPQPFVYGPVLFDSEDRLLEEPLTVLLSHLRSDLVEEHYGVDAEHYEMHLTFKGLNDLWLPEHDGAASRISLSNLVKLYSDVAEESGLGLVQLEPFQIVMTIQETFTSRLDALQIQIDEARAQKDLSAVQDYADTDTAVARPQESDVIHEEDAVLHAPVEQVEPAQLASDSIEQVLLEEDAESGSFTKSLSKRDNEAIEVNDSDSALEIGAALEGVVDIGSDDYLLDSAEIEQHGDSLASISDTTLNFTLKSTSPADRSPKRSLDELLELSDAEFDEMRPDREDLKKARVED